MLHMHAELLVELDCSVRARRRPQVAILARRAFEFQSLLCSGDQRSLSLIGGPSNFEVAICHSEVASIILGRMFSEGHSHWCYVKYTHKDYVPDSEQLSYKRCPI